ncbi:MAG: hypothetical protein PHO26_06385 [Dehalococcoidia bacterium]|nr:hypothetical protein [Dehalococcoidia bacterium]MDD5493691.1 hypothetical protein [Dehalococcoidia bacterium]
MAEKKLVAKTPGEEKVVIRSIRAEVEKLLAIKNDTKLWEQLRETYFNYSCVRITNKGRGEVAGYAILAGGQRIEVPRMFYNESQVIGKFEYIDVWFNQPIPKDPPIQVDNLSSVTYVDVSITIPNVGTKPDQMLWCAPMYPNSWTYWLNIPPMGRQHLLLLPVVGSGMRIDTLRENLKSQLGI